jgi:putative addiction module component (TIGR02574 family)
MIKMQEILHLSVEERLQMIEQIWDSIDHENIALPEKQQQELDRRLERHAAGETKFVSWESIKRELNSAR